MNLFTKTSGLALLLFAAVLAGGVIVAAEDKEEKEANEVTLTIDQLPAAVKATLESEAKGGKIGEIEKSDEVEGGYEAEITIDGKETDIFVDADGKVVK